MPRLGAHLSAAGGLWRAAAAAGELGCGALQVFLRPPGRWAATPLPGGAAERFSRLAAQADLEGACFAHAPYLLNLASEDDVLRQRSVDTLVDELERARELGLAGVVLHPGSAGTGSRAEAEARCRSAVTEAVGRSGGPGARLLLEGTAGMGGQLGTTPHELSRLVEPASRARVGVCLDSAHLWGAGYDLRADGWGRVLAELGSRRDRHAPPGEGALGEVFYRRLLADERLVDTPLVLEIPPGKDNELVGVALDRLRAWLPG
jgi:deoxyribonuclease-4